MIECPTCKGDGTVFCNGTDLTKNPPTKTGFDLPCNTCDGKGEVAEDQIITCTGCGNKAKENGYCEVDGSPYSDCCWSEHVENCEACKEQM